MHQKIFDCACALLALAIALGALIGMLLFAWHVEGATPWAEMKAADWGVWVGAIGTIATFIGTINLATNETRRRTRQENLAAEMHGVVLSSRLAHVEARLTASKKLLSKAMESEDLRAGLLKECHFQIAAIEDFPPEEVLPIAVFGGNTGAIVIRATAGLTALRHLSDMLGALAAAPDINRIKTMFEMVSDNLDMLNDAVQSLRSALQRSEFIS